MAMLHTVREWFRRKPTTWGNELRAPPELPTKRQSRLTPTSSCENFSPSFRAATAKSAIYNILPAEIRRAILIEAFGDRVIHMDLIYEHPPLPNTNATRAHPWSYTAHCNMNVDFDSGEDSPHLRLDKSRPKCWMWRSSVCHRNPPTTPLPGHQIQPSQDQCRFGHTTDNMCQLWPGEFPAKCFIGAMGWLQSCKQSYLEGIDVLYSTNTIHTASRELIIGLQSFLLPQRLSSIASVELLWDIDPSQWLHGGNPLRREQDLSDFQYLLASIPSTFSNVRHLHISLQGCTVTTLDPTDVNRYSNQVDTVDDDIMKPIDGMVQLLGTRVTNVSVAIPSSLYRAQRDRALEVGEKVEQAYIAGSLERHWRPLEHSLYRSGYWVQLGQKDLALPYFRDGISKEDLILYV